MVKITHVQEIDLGWGKIKSELRRLSRAKVKVGLPEGGTTSGRYDMDKLANVAAENEFGNSGANLPARPFMRSSFDENINEIKRKSLNAVHSISGAVMTAKEGLDDIGDAVASTIKKKILSGEFAPLSAKTTKRKGHDTILIETGQLISSIQHKSEGI